MTCLLEQVDDLDVDRSPLTPLSLVVYHRKTNFVLVLRVVHDAYFLQKMAHIFLGEIYLQGALGFGRVCFMDVKVPVLNAVWRHPCMPRLRLLSVDGLRYILSYTSDIFFMVASV